jgi:hypothetical protein
LVEGLELNHLAACVDGADVDSRVVYHYVLGLLGDCGEASFPKLIWVLVFELAVYFVDSILEGEVGSHGCLLRNEFLLSRVEVFGDEVGEGVGVGEDNGGGIIGSGERRRVVQA